MVRHPLAALVAAGARRDAARDQVRQAIRDRDAAIREALAAGHTPQSVAKAAGLTDKRVLQIKRGLR